MRMSLKEVYVAVFDSTSKGIGRPVHSIPDEDMLLMVNAYANGHYDFVERYLRDSIVEEYQERYRGHNIVVDHLALETPLMFRL